MPKWKVPMNWDWKNLVRVWVGVLMVLMVPMCLPCTAKAGGQTQGSPLVAEILAPAKPLRSGETGVIPVEIKNVSRDPIAVTFDEALRSYFFRFESNTSFASDGLVEGGNVDNTNNTDGCPGDIATYLIRPGQTIIQLVIVQVPKKSFGRANLDITLRVRHVRDPPHCSSAVPLDVSASAVVKIGG
jgi:hypothetical protein